MQEANQALAKLAQRDLMGFWYGLGTDDPVKLKLALLEFMPDLIATYGSAAAGLAADRYDELRADSIATGAFRAALADPLPDEQVQAVTRWALGPAFAEKQDLGAALTMLTDASQRLVRQQARNTVALNVERDPFGASYARVPKGKTTCAFCLMLASRGAVYGSKKSAETIRNSGKHYHTKCDCEAEPVWSGDDLARLKQDAGYDPDALYDIYATVHETGMTGKQTASALREAYDLK
jgi:hypothetical protein